MLFETLDDISVPIAEVFVAVTAGSVIERFAAKRGLILRRVDLARVLGLGPCWSTSFQFRGATRQALVDVIKFEPDHLLCFQTHVQGLTTEFTIRFTPISDSQTRLLFTIELLPNALPAGFLCIRSSLRGHGSRRGLRRVSGN
jgi:uncharacterized protein YndB with AHSA1/START domain